MYAIVKTGGKQYRVEEGQTLLVERLPADEGATVKLEPVLYRPDGKSADGAVLDRDGLGKVKISARVVGHERGPKLRVFKFKPKRGYRRTTGHRQELTRLEVTSIEGPDVAPKRAREAKPEAREAKPEAQSGPASDEKPAARTRAPRAKSSPAAEKAEPSQPKDPRSSSRPRTEKKEDTPDGT